LIEPLIVAGSSNRIHIKTNKEQKMSWKAPKIVELPVGMEINMYACAAHT
jgi:coenzyme PQQ precursor peptide PqqA